MKNDSFKEFILDQLVRIGDLRCRRMFGGYGFYHNDTFFGILSKDRLYFKTDSTTVSFYLKNGMEPFQPNIKQTLKSYYEVPAEIIEDSDELIVWAQRAVTCQLSKKSLENRV
jgi:DNA transformation protein